MKKKVFIFLLVILIIVGVLGIFIKKSSRQNITIPILLYHDFVSKVPDSDPDDFN